MEFLEKLIARNDAAPPLKVGTLSNLAALSRNLGWVERCIADMSSVETGIATDLLMRALRSADTIVEKIEAEESARAFFGGASRDVLLYESLLFCLYGLSARLRRIVPPSVIDANTQVPALAFMAATELAVQHLGKFDAPRHRYERAKTYVPHAGNVRGMVECLIDVLIAGRGSVTLAPCNIQALDANLGLGINLRGVLHGLVSAAFRNEARQVCKSYSKCFEPILSDRTQVLSEKSLSR
jgi:hypothetical protein